MMLFPGISQIQSALIGMAFGALVAGVGAGVLVHKINNGRYDALVAKQAAAHSKAMADEAKAAQSFSDSLTAAQNATAAVAQQLNAERARKQTVLHDVIVKEGKKDATLKLCLDRKLPDSILRQFPH